MLVKMLASLMCLAAFAAGALAAPDAPPEWLRKAEVYNGWYKHWTDDAMSRMEGIPVVAGIPLDRKLIDKAHSMGVRVLGYVTFYQMPPGQVYQNEDLAKHPDWNVILPDGTECKSIFEGTENTGWKTMCPNSPAYRKAALKYVKYVMDTGVDGLFIDNAQPDPVCEGPKFGRHKHIYPGSGLDMPYRELLKSVRALVKSYGSDNITMVNTGWPPDKWLGACDAQMIESYITSWAWDGHGTFDDARLLDIQKHWAQVSDRGTVLVSLSYFDNSGSNRKRDLFYTYAWCRITGFLWADWFTGGREANVLHKLRLGGPVGAMETGDGYYARRFERGIVVASGQKHSARALLTGHSRLFDVFNARHLNADPSGSISVELGPAEGRVYLTD